MRRFVVGLTVTMVIGMVDVLQVNIIPVIAKADTLTPEECGLFKKRVSRDVDLYSVPSQL